MTDDLTVAAISPRANVPLVERLRARSHSRACRQHPEWTLKRGPCDCYRILQLEAADALEAAREEIALLRLPMAGYTESGYPTPGWVPVDQGRLDDLESAEAENLHLREELKRRATGIDGLSLERERNAAEKQSGQEYLRAEKAEARYTALRKVVQAHFAHEPWYAEDTAADLPLVFICGHCGGQQPEHNESCSWAALLVAALLVAE